MSEKKHAFEVGTEVALIRDDGWRRDAHVTFTRVAKVHKNGNFVLESDPKQQYRPWSNGDASMTGDSFYRTTCKLATPEVRAFALTKRREKNWRDLAHLISKIDYETATDEMVAGLEAVLKMKPSAKVEK